VEEKVRKEKKEEYIRCKVGQRQTETAKRAK
jgi:hypothetical protein